MSAEDRQMLELAAKAAKIEICEWVEDGCDDFGNTQGFRLKDNYNRYSNPKNDDGDALRLAVMCRIEFYEGTGDGPEAWAGYWKKGAVKQKFLCESRASDQYAATRLAILRAAVEMGKAMP